MSVNKNTDIDTVTKGMILMMADNLKELKTMYDEAVIVYAESDDQESKKVASEIIKRYESTTKMVEDFIKESVTL